ncbi:MAG: Ldh family oxidoreductase [Chloroflexota bacterium]
METVRAALTVGWQDIVDFSAAALAGTGIPAEAARKAAIAQVDADLHGTVTHGLKNLRNYVTQLLDGRLNPKAEIKEVVRTPAAVVLEANNAHGFVAGQVGMEKAIEVAKQSGIGTAFVRGSNHYGASGYWARMALPENMIGFAITSAYASIAPWGGRKAIVGNNPPGWAIPTQVAKPGDPFPPGETDPVFLDFALSVVAGNRLDIFRRRGEPIPLGWALDEKGEPTTDASARAKGGTFMPISEYKGSGMALVLAMIPCFLGGGEFDDERFDGDGKNVMGTCSHWFMAYDIKQFVDPAKFTERVRALQGRIRAQQPRAGVSQVYSPGDIENTNAKRHRAEGIPLEEFVVEDLTWVAEHTGVATPW